MNFDPILLLERNYEAQPAARAWLRSMLPHVCSALEPNGFREVTNENPDRIGQPVLGRIDKRETDGVATGIAYANAATVLQDDNFIYYSSGTSIRRLPG